MRLIRYRRTNKLESLTHWVKALYSVNINGVISVFLWGDRPRPLKLVEFPAGRNHALHITNYGRGRPDWIATICEGDMLGGYAWVLEGQGGSFTTLWSGSTPFILQPRGAGFATPSQEALALPSIGYNPLDEPRWQPDPDNNYDSQQSATNRWDLQVLPAALVGSRYARFDGIQIQSRTMQVLTINDPPLLVNFQRNAEIAASLELEYEVRLNIPVLNRTSLVVHTDSYTYGRDNWAFPPNTNVQKQTIPLPPLDSDFDVIRRRFPVVSVNEFSYFLLHESPRDQEFVRGQFYPLTPQFSIAIKNTANYTSATATETLYADPTPFAPLFILPTGFYNGFYSVAVNLRETPDGPVYRPVGVYYGDRTEPVANPDGAIYPNIIDLDNTVKLFDAKINWDKLPSLEQNKNRLYEVKDFIPCYIQRSELLDNTIVLDKRNDEPRRYPTWLYPFKTPEFDPEIHWVEQSTFAGYF